MKLLRPIQNHLIRAPLGLHFWWGPQRITFKKDLLRIYGPLVPGLLFLPAALFFVGTFEVLSGGTKTPNYMLGFSLMLVGLATAILIIKYRWKHRKDGRNQDYVDIFSYVLIWLLFISGWFLLVHYLT